MRMGAFSRKVNLDLKSDKISKREVKRVQKLVIDLLKQEEPGKLLDIPCGSGQLSKYLEEAGFDVYRADINPDVVEVGAEKFVKADLNGVIGFSSDAFDYCICIEGIEHTFNPNNVVKELSRVLKAGGILYLSTPNVCRLKNRIHYFFTGINDVLEPAPLPVEVPHNFGLHVTSVPLPQLDYFFRKHGLEIQQVYAARYKSKSKLVSTLLRPFLRAKMKKAYRQCRDKNARIVTERLEKFMLSDEILSGEGMIIKAKKL